MQERIVILASVAIMVLAVVWLGHFLYSSATTEYLLVCKNGSGETVVNTEAWNIEAQGGYVVAHTDEGILYLDYRCTSTKVEK